MKRFKGHIDKAGIIGVIFSHLCCIGLGAQVGLVAPAFAPFLMNHRILLPFLLFSLAVSNLGIFFSYLRHKNIVPFTISIISSSIIIAFFPIKQAQILIYMGLIGLIGASIYNMVCSKKCKK